MDNEANAPSDEAAGSATETVQATDGLLEAEDPQFTLIVNYDVQLLSPNQRLHWATFNSRKQAVKFRARTAWERAGRPFIGVGRARVDFIIRRGRKIDPDNAVACLKSLIDGLFNQRKNKGAGIVPEDSERYFELGVVTQETGAKYKRFGKVGPHVEVIVTVLPEQS